MVRNHTLLKQVNAKIAYFRALRGIIMLCSIANALNIDMNMLVTFTDLEKAMWENNYQDDMGTEKRL